MLDDLTSDQRAAVTHPGGPLLVLAGAGAGKTRVLGRRLAWLVREGARPDEVVALTFTQKAAQELRGRAEAEIGRSHETLRVTTFHALAIELARVHGVERGILPAARQATDDRRALLLLDRLDELELLENDLRRPKGEVVGELIARIDRCRDELVTAERFRDWAERALAEAGTPSVAAVRRRDLEFARVFEAHDRWLADEGLEDFGLSIQRALDLLRAHPDRLAAARAGSRHLLVDEFQDTNHAQAELLYLLAEGGESLVAVGDDDQGIYGFRGASTRNIAHFRARYPDARIVRLELNHRSTQSILDAAGAVVERLEDRAPKVLRALPGAEGPAPAFWVAADEDQAAAAVAAGVALLTREGVPYEEQAVLMRAVRTDSAPVVLALERAGIPHQVHGGLGLFERREVRTALAWLRAVVDPSDTQAHLRLASAGGIGLRWTAAAQAVAEAAADGRSVRAALLDLAQETGAGRLVALLDELGPVGDDRPSSLVREVLDRTGLRRGAIAAGGAEGAARLAGLAALERLAGEIVAGGDGADAPALVARLRGLAEVGYRGDVSTGLERQGVQVMTIHGAKGLEFDAVFVVAMVQSSLPGRDRPGPDVPDALLSERVAKGKAAHVAEARRLTYVALTRARRHLALVTHRTGASGAAQRPSPFFEEARAALGSPPPVEVGDDGDRALLYAVGEARAGLEKATLRAAEARAAGREDAESLMGAVSAAVERLVTARTAALAPPAPTVAPSAPEPRPALPGIALSPTDIDRYRTCPLSYRFARVDRVPQRASAARAIGVAAHAALEAHHRPDGVGGDGATLVERFASELRRGDLVGTPEGDQALARAREWLPRYHERTARQRRRTLAVERDFTLLVGPHRVHGRIDRVDQHPAGGQQLVDYKTGRPPGEAGRVGDDLVMRLYLLGAREAWGADPRGATLEYVLDGGTRPVDGDPPELAEAREEARRVADAIVTRHFEPRPSWACRSCDFALICPAMDR